MIAPDGSGDQVIATSGGSPTWAPDGSAIAYVGGAGSFDGDGIYLADPNGASAPRQIVNGPAIMPTWSPDSQTLAFVRGSVEQGQVSVVRRDGSGEHAVGGAPSLAPVWAPDGRRLAFVLRRPEPDRGGFRFQVTDELHVVRADGTEDRVLEALRIQEIQRPAWTRGGRSVVFSGVIVENDREICVIRADGTGFRALTHNLLDDVEPRWSPDHKRIAFVRGRWEVLWLTLPADPSIYVMNSDGSHARRIASGQNPAWSPDGTQIAFDDGRDVYVVAAGGGARRPVARDKVWRSVEPSWSPDGRRIAFERARRIMIVSVHDGRPLFLTKPTYWDARPVWSPDGTSIAFDRTHNVCIAPASGGNVRCITKDGAGLRQENRTHGLNGESGNGLARSMRSVRTRPRFTWRR